MAEVNPKKVIEFNILRVDSIVLNGLDADPVDPADGEFWFRGDLHQARVRANGQTYSLDGTLIEE
jgi:hypothetical protein